MTTETTTAVGDSIQVATLKALQGLTGAIEAINTRLDRLEAPTATFQVAEPPKVAPKRRSAPKGAKSSGLDRFTPEMAKAIRNRRREGKSAADSAERSLGSVCGAWTRGSSGAGAASPLLKVPACVGRQESPPPKDLEKRAQRIARRLRAMLMIAGT